MKSEVRLLLAVGLMILVMVGTNILFPPVTPDEPVPADSAEVTQIDEVSGLPELVAPDTTGEEAPVPDAETRTVLQAVDREVVVVESPLYRFTFDNYGAALLSAELTQFESLVSGNGAVQLVGEGARALDGRVVVRGDTLELADVGFTAEPAGGLTLQEGDGPRTLTFSYASGAGFQVEVAYTFRPDDYLVDVETRVSGVDRPLLFTRLGNGLPFNEADSAQEAAAMAYVGNHRNDGIRSRPFTKLDESRLEEGPFRWVAFKSRYFVVALLPGGGVDGEGGTETYLGGLIAEPGAVETKGDVTVAHAPALDGITRYRVFMGPQEYARLQELGTDLEEVNPYGWRFFRPIIRPFVGIILWILSYLHNTLNIGYGWVLILFGVLMRVALWPLNAKAMRSQMKNMAVQPLMKEIQTRYKDNPERLQKEMMKLYKEHGFNPLGGCLPMLLPWPILIALFFVFQNTIEFRGVAFLWLPDLSAKDPLYILPVFLALSMFLLQWIMMRSMPESNPQMRFMMWFMPLFLGFLFLQFPSGLNLYYATLNIATLPQQILIAKERKKVKPITSLGGGGDDSGGSKPKGESTPAPKAVGPGGGGSRRQRRGKKKGR